MVGNISQKLKEIRAEIAKKQGKKKPINQVELAKITGISKSFISQLESGEKKNISSELLSLLQQTTGVNLNWLVNDKGPMFLDEESVEINKFQKKLYLNENEMQKLSEIINTSQDLPKEKIIELMKLLNRAMQQDQEAIAELKGFIKAFEYFSH